MQINKIRDKNRIDAYKQLESKNPFQQVLWSGIMGCTENIAFELLMAETVEINSGYQSTRRSMALRSILQELGNLEWSFRYFQKLFKRLEDKSLENQFSYLRVLVIDIFENWSGGRDLSRLICLGGVRKDLKLGDLKSLKNSLEEIKREYHKVLEYCLFDFVIKENLTDLESHLSDKDLDKIQFWPESFQVLSIERVEKLEKLLDKNLFSKLLSEQSSGEFKKIFWELYCSRLLNVLESMSVLSTLVSDLPEGDFRVMIEHLHIPGNHFVAQNTKAPSGKLFAYYCSGKLRFRSFSTYILGLIDRNMLSIAGRENILIDLLGVDLIQGALCEETH